MLNRRAWLGMVVGGLLTSACATEDFPPPITLADVLSALETVKTVSELIAKAGKPTAEQIFDYDNPNSPSIYARRPKESWNYGMIVAPPNLVDLAPKGTRILEFDFTDRHSDMNPTGAVVLVLVDPAGRILGWMRNTTYLGTETEAVRG